MTWEVDNYNGYPNVAQLNKIFSAIQDIADQGLQGPPGEDGADGVDGTNGWSPVLAIETDLEARYIKVVDWVGGTGTKPASGLYVTSTGLSASIDDAIDIRGPQGEAGVNGEDGSDAPNTFVDLIDTPDTLGTNGQVLTIGLDKYANPEMKWEDPQGGGASSLLDLNDTPDTVGVPGQYLAVTPYGTFDYADPAEAPTTEDILPSYTGNASKLLAVNSAESGVEWVEAPSGGGGGFTTGTFAPRLEDLQQNEVPATLYLSAGEYMDFGSHVWFSLRIDFKNSTNVRFVLGNMPFPMDGDHAFSIGNSANRDMPTTDFEGNPINYVTAISNSYRNQIWLVADDGNVVGTGVDRRTVLISGWYKKATT